MKKQGSGVKYYALTTSAYLPTVWQETNDLRVNEAGVYYLWVKDIAGNIGKINCQVEKDLSVINKEYITDKGYHCIEPYTCLKQGDYSILNSVIQHIQYTIFISS